MSSFDIFNNEELTELENSNDENVVKLAGIVRALARDNLRFYMRELCQKYLGQPWASGIEVSLWKAVVYRAERLSDEEVGTLERLSEQAGGWFHYPDGALIEQFVPLQKWREMYKEWEDQ